MRTIQKTISLEPMTSRLPSVWPAYKDNKLYFFDQASLKNRKYKYPCNYGMIPMSCSGNIYSFKDKVLSFETISKMYSFFKEYKHLLTKAGHCGKVYSSATDYYDSEINNIYVSELEYGTYRQTYEEMDAKYVEYGGNDMYGFICQYIVPTYNIPSAYTEYWKVEELYYPDVIKWISWFKERQHYESGASYTQATSIDIEHWNCKASGITDCCDCDEYFRRGGKRVMDDMVSGYSEIQHSILSSTTNPTRDISAITPSMIDCIELSNSLENVGQFKDLSPKYEIGTDYRGTNYGDSANTKGRTTAIDDSGSTIILKDGEKGYCFSPLYMEKTFDETAWDNYTLEYISGNPSEFTSLGYDFYGYDINNKFFSGNTPEQVESMMKQSGETYPISDINSILIDGTLIPIERHECGYYDVSNEFISKRPYLVYREDDTNTPYTIISGEKIYAEPYLSPTSGLCYYFSFFKNSAYTETLTCGEKDKTFNIDRYQVYGKNSSPYLQECITYNDQVYFISAATNAVTVDGITCPRINGYTYDKDGNIIYATYDIPKIPIEYHHIYDSNMNDLPSNYSISGRTVCVNTFNSDTIIYSVDELTGVTSSKLKDLTSTNRLVDDIGNDMEGIFVRTSASKYAQPPLGSVLAPLYNVGNTSLIAKFKLTKEKESEIESGVNYFVGNIITNMNFYLTDINGNRVNDTDAKESCSMTNMKSSLSAITKLENNKNLPKFEGIVFDEDIHCDITYYIGATLERKSGGMFKLAQWYNHGVKYLESVKFRKTPLFYGLKKVEKDEIDIMPTDRFNVVNLPHKYTIFTYELIQDEVDISSDDYGTIYRTPLAKFSAQINLIDSSLAPKYSGYSDMDTWNGVNVSPTFKEEYQMGMAAKENIDVDIYIDRGINSAFEKHLKLGEITSLEALEQLGLNFFTIKE